MLKYIIEGPSLIILDNLDVHISDKCRQKIASYGCELISLPKNCTSILQPLDVGVFGPLKRKLSLLNLDNNNRCLTSKQKRRNTIQKTMQALDSISEETIKKSFDKTIFSSIGNSVNYILV